MLPGQWQPKDLSGHLCLWQKAEEFAPIWLGQEGLLTVHSCSRWAGVCSDLVSLYGPIGLAGQPCVYLHRRR